VVEVEEMSAILKIAVQLSARCTNILGEDFMNSKPNLDSRRS
jgi:hypothetical protein